MHLVGYIRIKLYIYRKAGVIISLPKNGYEIMFRSSNGHVLYLCLNRVDKI